LLQEFLNKINPLAKGDQFFKAVMALKFFVSATERLDFQGLDIVGFIGIGKNRS
jgi:hypothetical protein